MAKPLILSLDGHEIPVQLLKVDRSKLYGEIEIEAFDEKGNAATLKVLAADGKTLIDKGGTALTTVTEEGRSISRSDLVAVDENGDEIDPVPSSFGQINVLKRSTAEEYLSQIVKSIYLLEPADESALDYLYSHLDSGLIYSFPFSYRGGIDYDSAFVLGHKTEAFMVVGKQAALDFVRLNEASVLDSPDEQEISADEIEFDLF